MSREIEVWGDWQELADPTLMGHLRSSLTRGKEVFSFTYDEEWLKGGAARQLDPELQLYGGPQYLGTDSRPNFGLFLDSSPDRLECRSRWDRPQSQHLRDRQRIEL